MANQIEINIFLKGDGEQQAVNDNTGTGGDIQGMSQSGSTQSGDTKSTDKNMRALGKYISSQTIETFIGNTKSAISQNIGLITGKTELQQRVNFGMELAQQGVNTFKNAQAGKLVFQGLGLSGSLGVAVGAALSIISTGINLVFQQEQLNIRKSLENLQIQQTRTRAGAGFNRSREGI